MILRLLINDTSYIIINEICVKVLKIAMEKKYLYATRW